MFLSLEYRMHCYVVLSEFADLRVKVCSWSSAWGNTSKEVAEQSACPVLDINLLILSSDFWHNAFIFNQVDAFFLKIAFVCDIYVCMSTPEAVNS